MEEVSRGGGTRASQRAVVGAPSSGGAPATAATSEARATQCSQTSAPEMPVEAPHSGEGHPEKPRALAGDGSLWGDPG